VWVATPLAGYLNSYAKAGDMDDLFEGMQRLRSDYEQVLGAGLADPVCRVANPDSRRACESDESSESSRTISSWQQPDRAVWSGLFQQITTETTRILRLQPKSLLDTLGQCLNGHGRKLRAMMDLILRCHFVGLLMIIYLTPASTCHPRHTLKRLIRADGQVRP